MQWLLVSGFFFFDVVVGVLEVFNDVISVVVEKRQFLMKFIRVGFISEV